MQRANSLYAVKTSGSSGRRYQGFGVRILLLLLVYMPFQVDAQTGALDPAFGIAGVVTTPILDGASCRAIGIQSDGKILAAGHSYDSMGGGTQHIAVARFQPDGELDPGFGFGGAVSTLIGTGAADAYALTVQPDGKILAAGYAFIGGGLDIALVRYQSDGALDFTFGTNGIVTLSFGSGQDIAYGMVLQPDGKILLTGAASSSGTDLCLVRLQSDGSMDGFFGSGGAVITSIGAYSEGRAIVLQPDGNILVAGSGGAANDQDLVVARYASDGSLDPTFGIDGVRTIPISTDNDQAHAMVVQPDGKILLGGIWGYMAQMPSASVMVRLDSTGDLDETFAASGLAITPWDPGGASFNTLCLQPNGRILTGGYGPSNPGDFILTRFMPDGTLDPSWGDNGVVSSPMGGSFAKVNAIVLQSDGKAVVGGEFEQNVEFRFVLARFLTDDFNIIPEDPTIPALRVTIQAGDHVTLVYVLPLAMHVDLYLRDASGRIIQQSALGNKPAGEHVFQFDLAALADGLYMIHLITPEGHAIHKVLKSR